MREHLKIQLPSSVARRKRVLWCLDQRQSPGLCRAFLASKGLWANNIAKSSAHKGPFSSTMSLHVEISLHSRLVSSNIGGCLVALKGACNFGGGDIQQLYTLSCESRFRDMTFFQPNWDPHAVTWRTFVERLHSKETAHPSALPLKHFSFQYPNSRAIGCNLTWKEHLSVCRNEGSINFLAMGPLHLRYACPSDGQFPALWGATLRRRKKRTSSDHPNSWEGRADYPSSQELHMLWTGQGLDSSICCPAELQQPRRLWHPNIGFNISKWKRLVESKSNALLRVKVWHSTKLDHSHTKQSWILMLGDAIASPFSSCKQHARNSTRHIPRHFPKMPPVQWWCMCHIETQEGLLSINAPWIAYHYHSYGCSSAALHSKSTKEIWRLSSEGEQEKPWNL